MRETLIKAKELLAKGWCQKYYCVDKDGEPLLRCDRNAAKYCISGAIAVALDGKDPGAIYAYVSSMSGRECIAYWNDDPIRCQADVLDLIDNCIKELET